MPRKSRGLAGGECDADILAMKTFVAVAVVLMLLVAVTLAGGHAVRAQDFSSPPNILPPPPPPPPKLEVPRIPKLGEIPNSPSIALPQRGSFSDRITQCIEEGAAAGLGPNERAAFSRACANQ